MECGLLFDEEQRYPGWFTEYFFATTPNLSTATEDIRSPNTMTSVTCSRAVLKLSYNLNGSPTNSG